MNLKSSYLFNHNHVHMLQSKLDSITVAFYLAYIQTETLIKIPDKLALSKISLPRFYNPKKVYKTILAEATAALHFNICCAQAAGVVSHLGFVICLLTNRVPSLK